MEKELTPEMILLQNLKIRRDIQKLESAISEGIVIASAEQRVILSQKDLVNSEIQRLEDQLYGNSTIRNGIRREEQMIQYQEVCCSFLDNVPSDVNETFNNVRLHLAKCAWFDDATF